MEKKHKCTKCEKGFQFVTRLKLHKQKYSRKELIPCTHCTRKFTVNAQMLLHAQTHQNQYAFSSDNCSHKTNLKYNLSHHMRGAHGEGWKAFCGEKFNWPSKKFHHAKSCVKCAKVKKDTTKQVAEFEKKIKKGQLKL